MTSTSFVFTELADTMKYGKGFLYNLVFTEWRHCVLQNIYSSRSVKVGDCQKTIRIRFHDNHPSESTALNPYGDYYMDRFTNAVQSGQLLSFPSNVELLLANVVDGGPTVNQLWANVSSLLGCLCKEHKTNILHWSVCRAISSGATYQSCAGTIFRRLGAKGSYLTLVRVADRII